MRAKISFVGVLLAMPFAVLAASAADRLKELNGEIRWCSSIHSCWCSYNQKKWTHDDMNGTGPCDRKILDEMQAKCLRLSAERCSLAPKNEAYRTYYGDALVFAGRYAEAEAEYRKSLALAQDGSYEYAGVMYKIAEAQYAGGDREGAVATLKALCDRRLVTIRRDCPDWVNLASVAYAQLTGADLDDQRLPRFTDAKAYPEPQQARYSDEFVSCESVTVRLSGVKEDDVRVGLLKRKLEARGVRCEVAGILSGLWTRGFVLDITLDSAAPVEKSEGYSLVIGEKGASIRARDPQGVLWGVVSFIQVLDPDKKTVRRCEINDWPDVARRGFLGTGVWSGGLEFALFNKISSVVFLRPFVKDGAFSPLNEYSTARLAEQFRKFGLELYFGIHTWTMNLGIPYSKPALLAIQTDVCKRFAAMGAGVYYPNDDMRYATWHEIDRKAGIAPSDIDAKHLAALYAAVRREYPDFRFIYCPPYYWGPDSKAAYPDDREKYLKSLRVLPPEVDVYWTGPRVKGIKKEKRQTDWYAGLIGRRPSIFQNATGPHNLLGYVVDATDWNSWHYPGFFENDVACFHKNAHTPTECCQIATLADCLWNVKGYDKDRSVKRGVNQLLGEKMYDILAPGLPALAYFDKYKYGGLTADILHEDVKDLETKANIAGACWKRAVEYCPDVRLYGDIDRGVDWANGIVRSAKNPPDFLAKYKDQADACRAFAEKEVGVDKAKGDLFFSPVDITGGEVQKAVKKDRLSVDRFATALRGASTCFNVLSLRFECDPFPPSGDYALYLCGLDDELPAKNKVRIVLNDVTIFEGDPGFENETAFSVKKFTIPFKTMKRYNILKVVSLAPGDTPSTPPWTLINYAVIKKTEGEVRFSDAKPVWAVGRAEQMNTYLGFRGVFDWDGEGKAVLRFTGVSLAKFHVNGAFAGYGPARGPDGWFRVDEYDVTPLLKKGRNLVTAEAACYNTGTYYIPRHPGFLQAEIVCGNRVLWATGEKTTKCYEAARIRRTTRSGFQRAFSEAYRVKSGDAAWRTDSGVVPGPALALEIRPAVRLLERGAPYPRFEISPKARPVSEARVEEEDVVVDHRRNNSLQPVPGKFDCYAPAELEYDVYRELRRLKTRETTPADPKKTRFALGNGKAAIFSWAHIDSGFPRLVVRVTKPGRLVFAFDEVLRDGRYVDAMRQEDMNAITWFFDEPGVYELEGFEANCFKYMEVAMPEGEGEMELPELRRYVNPEVGFAQCPTQDPELKTIFEAARETLAQNAVDLFTDCPGRERAGWLCDSFFIGRAAQFFCGNARMERTFLSNFALAEKFPHIPAGMVPMCYPADHQDGMFIPNWSMWLILELTDYLERTGDRETVDLLRPRVEGLVDFFAKLENEEGLLENLPSWVFVEWSEANNYTKGVNYPSNMCWARTLEAVADLYGRPELKAKAERLKATIRRRSFDGTWFVDQARRDEQGVLRERKSARTETCQYYAFYFGTATKEAYPDLWKKLATEFGPNRAKKGLYPEIAKSNAFIGNYLRLEILTLAGMKEQVVREIRGYFSNMAEKTGTLWEMDAPSCSCCHGFAAYVGTLLARNLGT